MKKIKEVPAWTLERWPPSGNSKQPKFEMLYTGDRTKPGTYMLGEQGLYDWDDVYILVKVEAGKSPR